MPPGGKDEDTLLVVWDTDPSEGATEVLMLPGLMEEASPVTAELVEERGCLVTDVGEEPEVRLLLGTPVLAMVVGNWLP